MAKKATGAARFQRAERRQVRILMLSLEQMLPDEHPVRLVWAYVESLDLSSLYARIRAVEGSVGRDPIDPRILMALWLWATIDGVGSARRLDRLCEEQLPYQWLCGEVTVNYHTLADFRVAHGDFLNKLLTQSVAALLHQGLVELTRVGQDGMRVRAAAGSGSFRRQATLEQCLDAARQHLDELRQEADAAHAAEGLQPEDAARDPAPEPA